jgi:protoporphyrinogen/coproporphyrinogen III oxidase
MRMPAAPALHADRQPVLLAADDAEMVSAVRAGLRDALGLREAPLASRVYRWPHGVASYQVHHLERLQRLRSALADHPGLVLAGAGYHGVGIPECLRQGEEAAAAVLGLSPPLAGTCT